MSDPTFRPAADTEAQPGDLAAIARARRLMLVTMGATFLALAVVLVFIGYRVFRGEGRELASIEVTAQLPKGARIVATTMADGRIAVTIETPAGTEIRTFDARTLKPAGRLRFSPEP